MFNRRPKLNPHFYFNLGIAFFLVYILLASMWSISAEQAALQADKPYESLQTPTNMTFRIMGTLRDADGPINDAEIYLQYFEDEKCAKLFKSRDYNPYDEKAVNELKERLKKCSHDLAPIKPDEQGRYQFEETKPGWYAIRFLWNIHQKPKEPMAYFEQNGFIIGYSSEKDLQKKYDAMAQGMPFYFSGKKNVVIDYKGKYR
jgi:hypothetical protein